MEKYWIGFTGLETNFLWIFCQHFINISIYFVMLLVSPQKTIPSQIQHIFFSAERKSLIGTDFWWNMNGPEISVEITRILLKLTKFLAIKFNEEIWLI